MPLDVDRLANEVLAGTQALIAKAIAPLRAENEGLRSLADSLQVRVLELEGRPVPALVTERALTVADGDAIKAAWDERHGEIAAKVERAITIAEEARSAAVGAAEPPPLPDVPALVADAVKAAVDALPKPRDGKDADPAEIVAIRGEIAEVKAAIPAPVEMPDLSGFATKADVDAVREAIPVVIEPKDFGPEIEAVRAAIPDAPDLSGFATKADVAAVREAIPEPKDFSAEIAGITARLDAIRMPEVIHGKDGVGIADVKLNDDREVLVKYTNGETVNLGSFDGRDGFGLEEFDVEYDGERTLKFAFRGKGRTAEHSYVVPLVLDRGIWKDGKTYDRGDALTYGGDFWIAQGETSSRPGTDKTWRLAVRKGRDAKPVTR